MQALNTFIDRAAQLDGTRMVVAANDKGAVDGQALGLAAHGQRLHRRWGPDAGDGHGGLVLRG